MEQIRCPQTPRIPSHPMTLHGGGRASPRHRPFSPTRRGTAYSTLPSARLRATIGQAGSGDENLEPGQQNAVTAIGASRVPRAGSHAEIAALDYARSRGEFPQYIASSRPFCPECRKEIEGRGGLITSPTTAVFPRNIPLVAFPSQGSHPSQ